MQCSDRRKLMWMTLNITTIVLILFTGEKNKNYIYVKILLILLFKVFNLLMNLNWYSITWQLKQWILVLLLLSFFIFILVTDDEKPVVIMKIAWWASFFFTFSFLNFFSWKGGMCYITHTWLKTEILLLFGFVTTTITKGQMKRKNKRNYWNYEFWGCN